MQRSSIIATVIAAGGVLIAGSVASVAVINAASSSQPDSGNVQLVAAGSSATQSAEPTMTASPASTDVAAQLPTMEASKLPELPEVSQPAAQPAAVAAAPAAQPASKPSKSKASDDDSQPSQSASPEYTVTAEQARSTVLDKGQGVAAVSTSKEDRQGVSTWAVRFTRSNGEVLTGYVNRQNGAVIDWVVNREATAQPTPTASYDDDSDDSDDDSNYEDESDEDESDEDDD